ncbi:hypothetical protein D3C81_1745300 [compost metagenome]|uniref:Uncharacterized protein n=1 Tax=Paenibacillus stellifer TaxID=169760 RepID=A0A089LMW6_9BACL|nr:MULTISPECIES: hypothetical protein [Paenibacillus]AIQ62247.1 hypothetical protein PSTEL_03055 [Paenibacillus stellifer]MBY9079914.1 hypothetical protein [Paenibacillus sp. CGMCC 1.18879]MBY9084555.1 hypothetical protein [Paenibacillus sinensis]
MKGKNVLAVAVSILLIVISSQIPSEKSAMLGVVQQLLLGVGLIGCLLAMWRFIKGGKKS